jgi:hypothetical protein
VRWQWGTVAIAATLAFGGCGGGTTTPRELRAELKTCRSDFSLSERNACFRSVMRVAEDMCSATSQFVVIAPDLTVTCASSPKDAERSEASAKAVLAAVPHHCWSAREGATASDCHLAAIGAAIVQLERLVRASCPTDTAPFVGAERAVVGCAPRRLPRRG